MNTITNERQDTMPFNDFERRADGVIRGIKHGDFNDEQAIEAQLLIKEMLFEIRRLRNKLVDIRKVLSSEDYLT